MSIYTYTHIVIKKLVNCWFLLKLSTVKFRTLYTCEAACNKQWHYSLL